MAVIWTLAILLIGFPFLLLLFGYLLQDVLMKMIAKTSLLFLFISAFLVLGWAFHEEPRLQEEAIRHMEMFSIHKADAIHFVRDADTKPIASRIFFWPGRTLFEIFPSERSLFHA